MKQPLRVLVAASGTGGHLFPALHIARAFRESDQCEAQVEFLGSGRPLEAQLIEPAGFARHEVKIVGLKRRGFRGLIEFLVLLPRALARIWALMNLFRPQVIVGVGGYASVLPVLIGYLRGIPTWIHEAELRPGLANFWLSLFADRVSLAFKEAWLPIWANTTYTGHPVRPGLAEIGREERSLSDPPKLLVLGGSQGARAVDEAMGSLAPFLAERGILVCHQCRQEGRDALEESYQKAGARARVVSFVEDMVSAFAWADIVISRSGAGAVMELSVVNRPAILIPYPFAQGGHQRANAKSLSDHGKALLVEEGDGFVDRLRHSLESLLKPQEYRHMRAIPFEARSVDASERIVKGCLAITGVSR